MGGGRAGREYSHRPDEARVPLLIEPGVEVIGDPQGLEAGLLRQPGLPDQLGGAVFLRGQEVAVTGHWRMSFRAEPP